MAGAQLVKGQEHWKFNVGLRAQEFTTMTKCLSTQGVRVCSVVAPMMYNTVRVGRGERLLLEVKKEKKTPDISKQKPAWQKEQKDKEKKRKKDGDDANKAPKDARQTTPGQGVRFV